MSNLVNTDNVSTYKLMYETMKHDHEYPNTNYRTLILNIIK